MTRKAWIFVSLLAAALVFPPIGSAQAREVWLKLERNGRGYGFDHIVVHKLKDGRIKYEVYEKIQTDVTGINPQSIIQEGVYIVDKNLRPLFIDLNIKFQTKEMFINGVCRNGTMSLFCLNGADQVIHRELPFTNVYFELVLGSVTFKKRHEKDFTLKVFNPYELKINDYAVEIIQDNETGIDALVRERITMRFRMDGKGRIKQVEFLEVNGRSYRTDERDARNIDFLNTADGLTLMVRSPDLFPNFYRVKAAQILLKWKDIPLEDFIFEDNRQRILEVSNEPDRYQAVLELRNPIRPLGKIIFPIKDDGFAAYLGETDFIRPTDPAIRQQLEVLKEDGKQGFALVHKLLLWVYDNVQADYIAETLTGPEVLRLKRGKCSEFTALFASLARAAGIPTRVAFGESIRGDAWIGHLWCEVWLGDWVAVDASHGIFIENPTHIKLMDSPSLAGTQKIRWKLVDNLSIEILNYTEK